jgi:hypothetical protein
MTVYLLGAAETRGHAAAWPILQDFVGLFVRRARQFVFFGASVVLAVVEVFLGVGGFLSEAAGVFFAAGAAGLVSRTLPQGSAVFG